MKHSPYVPWIGAVAFFVAILSSLFYHGFVADFFCIAQVLLLLWLSSLLWRGGREGIPLPRSTLALLLAAYAGWLALTLLWGTVPNYNIVTFWGLASLPLVFWLYAIDPDREALWRRAAPLVVLLALTLSAYATYQLTVRALEPKSVFLDLNSHATFLALIALPVAGYFLASFVARAAGVNRGFALGAAVFVLVYAVALTGGRGAMIALMAGMLVLLGVAWGRAPRRATVTLVLLVVTALIVGNLVAQGKTATRLLTLVEPEAAGMTRFLIWEQAWAIVKDSPWLGKGLGAFGLVFPAYQNPLESSAGFMVHTDSLQLWLEAGLPGLILLLAVYAAALTLFMRVLRCRKLGNAKAVECAGLFGGLLAVAMHSFVNFHLYVLPTSLGAGMVLGRFHALAMTGSRARVWNFRPTRHVRLSVYRGLLVLVAIAGVGYWVTQSLANYAFNEAAKLVESGKPERADEVLSRAHWLSPDSEMVLVGRAELYRYVINGTPALAAKDKHSLFQAAMEALDRAEKLNPYRADIPFLRARLQWLMKAEAGEDWKAQTVHGYEQANRLQPRFYTARLELAAFWLEQGETAKAREWLEQGMVYHYVGYERIVPYYRLTAALRRQAGDVAGAEELERRIADILSVPPEKRTLALDQARFVSIYDLWRRFRGLFGGG